MKISQFLLATLKETPADAELISHQLMLRAGMIRKLASGIYSWLPLGLRVLHKITHIVREEMNRIGALEMLLPSMQPAELWEETERWQQFGPELLKLQDRHQRAFCYGPTHEEVITDLMRCEIRSYKQLPCTLYQIQTKFRDEIRPRFGVMRAREFLMKDAYSFHLDNASLEETYQLMYDAYTRIFTRLELNFRPVLADTGSIGGKLSHEFHALADSGEDVIAFSDNSDYAANLEYAQAQAPQGKRPAANATMELVKTPGQHTIAMVSDFLKVQPQQTVKTLIVNGSDDTPVALVLRGDHTLNTIKAEKLPQIATPLRFTDEAEIIKLLQCKPGSLGPVNLNMLIIADRDAAQLADFICGANQDDKHLSHVNWGRDLPEPEIADLRNVVEGDLSPDGDGALHLARGIEIGHIFQLGDKYSQQMDATALNEQGSAIAMQMGCYGIGISRIAAASIEQHHDDRGIIWPDSIAPFHVALIAINSNKSQRLHIACHKLYQDLLAANFDVLWDDRKERPGVMFANMDLIGIPHRLVLSEKGLDQHSIEYKSRKQTNSQDVSLDKLITFLREQLQPG